MTSYISEDLINRLNTLNKSFCSNSHFYLDNNKPVPEIAFQLNRNVSKKNPHEFVRQRTDILEYPPHKAEIFRTIHGKDPNLVLFVIDIDYGLQEGESVKKVKKKFVKRTEN